MLRFSVASLLLFVFFAAVGSAALANPTDLWRQITVTLTVATLLFAALAAAYSRGASRTFAGGLALAGWLYFILAFVGAFGLRDNLLTDTAVEWIAVTIHGDQAGIGSGPSSSWLDLANDEFEQFVWFTQGNGRFAMRQPGTPIANLIVIGHALWAIVVGCLGGMVAAWFGSRKRGKLEEHRQ